MAHVSQRDLLVLKMSMLESPWYGSSFSCSSRVPVNHGSQEHTASPPN